MALRLRGLGARALPHADIPNIRISYALVAAESSAFISGNWIFYWTLFMTYSQLGLNDALAFAFGLFMEIPTGALADLIGKRWTMRAAMLFNGFGFLVMGAAEGIPALIGGFLLFQTGIALSSGASDALAYDSLKERGRDGDWDKVSAAFSSVSQLTLMVTILLGAPLFHLNVRLPHLAWGAVYLAAFVLSLRLTEPKVDVEAHFSLKGYARQLVMGARQLGRPALRPFVPLLFGLTGLFFIYSWGVVMPAVAVNFGFGADAQAFITSGAYLLIAVAVRFLPRVRRKTGDFFGLTLVNIGLMIATTGMALPLGAGGAAVMLLMHLCGQSSRTWTNVIVNERTPSDIRATTLSTVALITRLPYTLVAVVAGLMIDGGHLSTFMIGMTVVSLTLLVTAYVIWARTVKTTEILPAAEIPA